MKDEVSFVDSVVQGAGWATGFFLVCVVVSIALAVIYKTGMQIEVNSVVDAKNLNMKLMPRTVTRTVPSRSVEECLRESGGEANEFFAKCRTGYTYTEQIRDQ